MKMPGNQDHLPFNIDNLRISIPGNRSRTYMVPRSYHQGSDEGDFDHLREGGGSPGHSDSNADEDVPYMPRRIASPRTASRGSLLAPDDSEQQSRSPGVVYYSPQFTGNPTQQRPPVAGGGYDRDRASGHAVRRSTPQSLGPTTGLRLLAPNYAGSGAPHVQHNRNLVFPGDRGHPSTGLDTSRVYAAYYEPTYSPASVPQATPSEAEVRWLEDTEQYLRGLLNIPIGHPVNLYSLPDPPAGERPGPLPNLVKLAIFGSPGRRLTLQGICNALEERFDWFRAQSTWKGSIRHLLTLQKMIVKTPRPINEPGKGSYWTLDISQGEGPTHERKRRDRKRSSKEKDEQIESEMAADYDEISSSNTGSPLIGESLLPEGSHGLHRRQPARRRTSPYPPSLMTSPINNTPSTSENAIGPLSMPATGAYTMPGHMQTHPAFGQPSLMPHGFAHPPSQTAPPFGYPPFTRVPFQGVNAPQTSGFTTAAGPYIPIHPGQYPASTHAIHAAQVREQRPQEPVEILEQMQSGIQDTQLDPALLGFIKANEEGQRTKDRKSKRRQL